MTWLSYHRHRSEAVEKCRRDGAPGFDPRLKVMVAPHPDPEYGGLPVWWVVEVSA